MQIQVEPMDLALIEAVVDIIFSSQLVSDRGRRNTFSWLDGERILPKPLAGSGIS